MSDVCAETREMDTETPLAPVQRGETMADVVARGMRKFCGGGAPVEQPQLREPTQQHAPVGIERSQPREREEEPLHEPCSPGETQILEAIRERRRGNGITAHELGAIAHVTERKARAIVSHLIEVHEEALCSTPADSFFYADRWEDIQHTVNSLASRRDKLTARINGIEAGARRRFGTPTLPGMR